MKTQVSYIIPHNKREELLEYNLKSLVAQTVQDFEIIIVDNSADTEPIKDLVSRYRKIGLNIKLFFVDPQRCFFSHDKSVFGNLFNPAVQQNVGAKKSKGKILVLTSPEVINASTNVENIIKKFDNEESRFVRGWIDEDRKENPLVRDIIKNNYNISLMKASFPEPYRNGSIRAFCKEGDCFPRNYFLGCIRRRDFMRIGGIEEIFMAAICHEDDEFARRCSNNSIHCSFEGNIAGIHLFHGNRAGQNPIPMRSNANGVFYGTHKYLIANPERPWGSDDYIIGEFSEP